MQRSQASVFAAASTALVCYRYTPVRPHISISMHFCFRRISPLLTETTSQLSGIANINTRILFLIETSMLPRNDSSGIERVLNLVPSKKGMFVSNREKRERERENRGYSRTRFPLLRFLASSSRDFASRVFHNIGNEAREPTSTVISYPNFRDEGAKHNSLERGTWRASEAGAARRASNQQLEGKVETRTDAKRKRDRRYEKVIRV